eukprot:3003420-Alexandrium_andersonii.AAC.1
MAASRKTGRGCTSLVLRVGRRRALALPGPTPERRCLRLADILAPRVEGESMERPPPPMARRARSN